MSRFSHASICSFLVNHQRMDIRKISQENIYKLFTQLQIGEYAYISVTDIKCIYALIYTQTCTLSCIHVYFSLSFVWKWF